jgi:3-methyladenine DNA glycosylase AlkC
MSRLTLATVPLRRRNELAQGTTETTHLLEWLSVDMSKLLAVVASQLRLREPIPELIKSTSFHTLGITQRLKVLGQYLHDAGATPGTDIFEQLSRHPSDVVRQWAAYALMADAAIPLPTRLKLTKPFAADRNMSVREVAWMTFRPYAAARLREAVKSLRLLADDSDPNIRRFAVEVTRPRSVWGAHLDVLKRDPEVGRELVEATNRDASKYVQNAVGNWINDASKTRPDWVVDVATAWLESRSEHTRRILRRGVRTLRKDRALPAALESALFT